MWAHCRVNHRLHTWTSSRLLNPLYSSKIRNWDKGVELRSHRSQRRRDTCLSRTFTSRLNSKKLASKAPDWLSCNTSYRTWHTYHNDPCQLLCIDFMQTAIHNDLLSETLTDAPGSFETHQIWQVGSDGCWYTGVSQHSMAAAPWKAGA